MNYYATSFTFSFIVKVVLHSCENLILSAIFWYSYCKKNHNVAKYVYKEG